MRNLKKILSLFILILLPFVANLSWAQDPGLPQPVGRVIWIKGTLKAVMPTSEERKLAKMSVIYLHDTLVTDDSSQAQIAFTDNSLMTFEENTQFVIDQYEFKNSKKGASVGKYVMNLIEGGFRTITGLIAKNNPNDYKVNTPVATIGVRGTDYAISFRGGKLSIAHYGGTPCVSNKQGNLCLSDSVQFASVGGSGVGPVALKQAPKGMEQKLEIKPAKIDSFGTSSSGEISSTSKGPITNFCITQ